MEGLLSTGPTPSSFYTHREGKVKGLETKIYCDLFAETIDPICNRVMLVQHAEAVKHDSRSRLS